MTRYLLGECLFKYTEKAASCGRHKKAMTMIWSLWCYKSSTTEKLYSPEQTISLGKVEQCKMAKRTEMDNSSKCHAIRLEGDERLREWRLALLANTSSLWTTNVYWSFVVGWSIRLAIYSELIRDVERDEKEFAVITWSMYCTSTGWGQPWRVALNGWTRLQVRFQQFNFLTKNIQLLQQSLTSTSLLALYFSTMKYTSCTSHS